MCRLFIGADQKLWASRTKSLRIDGVATSIRMEKYFWATLEEIAVRDDMTVNQLITKLYLEAMDADHDLGNFTSFLRVCCARYLGLIAAREISDDLLTPLSVPDPDAIAILDREQKRQSGSVRASNSAPKATVFN
ncbi:ribbon-helix-helix domain-containing protein [Qingshengfaniella alkalisoli]|uniref:Ribbon-helix-helix domain-containing protein n=1 Tax=Qingshengfaniella alkalisoli TaxID=2599296 RepID=A0A5B8IYW9_9RHOB|nr:ribbon-helix-helix domain-containing protein [Qingshengfaniella alkalisoli]QDY71322.1 ribbon-helix-helix domain-containing protein [Qingshengfaniella alkalisoli]